MVKQHVLRHLVSGTAIVALTISLSACDTNRQEKQVAPKLECQNITVEYGSNFNAEDCCLVDTGTTLSTNGLDTTIPGEHQVEIIASRNGSFTISTITVTVEEEKALIECPENSLLNEESGECDCIEGYEKDETDACIVIPKEEPKPNPQPAQTQNHDQGNTGQQQQQTPVYSHGTQVFSAGEYGSLDGAFDACVVKCQSLPGACECNLSSSGDSIVLTY